MEARPTTRLTGLNGWMTAAADLVSFSRADLEELYRYWSGEAASVRPATRRGAATPSGALMGDRARVMARFQELPEARADAPDPGPPREGPPGHARAAAAGQEPADGVRALMADPALGVPEEARVRDRGARPVLAPLPRAVLARPGRPRRAPPVRAERRDPDPRDPALAAVPRPDALEPGPRVAPGRARRRGARRRPTAAQLADELARRDRVLQSIKRIGDESLRDRRQARARGARRHPRARPARAARAHAGGRPGAGATSSRGSCSGRSSIRTSRASACCSSRAR